jgi:hypothetical protein
MRSDPPRLGSPLDDVVDESESEHAVSHVGAAMAPAPNAMPRSTSRLRGRRPCKAAAIKRLSLSRMLFSSQRMT